jgi:hypothetical protein
MLSDHGTTYEERAQIAETKVQDLTRKLKEAQINAERYEIVRRMNPKQFADAWELNVRLGKPFDDIISDLKPFLKPSKGL